MIPLRTCKSCEREFPATTEYFYRKKGGKYGLREFCKECKKSQDKKYFAENKQELSEKQRVRYESNKEEITAKYRAYYAENQAMIRQQRRESRKNWDKETVEKIREKMQRYYIEHREKMIFTAKSYRHSLRGKENNKKVKEKRKNITKNLEKTLTQQQWAECIEHFEKKCCYCGKQTKLQQEHFIPVSKGGEYSINNIIPACVSCNSSKNNRDFFEWYPCHKVYSKRREQKILRYLNYSHKNQQLSIL